MHSTGPWALLLEGWDDYSIWGYDPAYGSLYAQITHNTSNDDDGPDVWITPGPAYPVITSPATLAGHIAHATGASVAAVAASLNDAVDNQGAPASLRVTTP